MSDIVLVTKNRISVAGSWRLAYGGVPFRMFTPLLVLLMMSLSRLLSLLVIQANSLLSGTISRTHGLLFVFRSSTKCCVYVVAMLQRLN